jgi:hypothetical protein
MIGVDSMDCGMNQSVPCGSLGQALRLYLKGGELVVIRVSQGVYSGENNTVITFGSGVFPSLTISADVGVVVDFGYVYGGWRINSYPSNLTLHGIIFTRMSGLGVSFAGAAPTKVIYRVTECIFDNNNFTSLSKSEGLDIMVGQNIEMIIEKSNFTNNNFYNYSEALNWSYGPLILHSGTIQVEGCSFVNNVLRSGPLTILNSDDNLPALNVIVNNCYFSKNYGLESASVYSRKIRATERVELSNLLIEDNTGIISVIALSEGLQIISNSIIRNNRLDSNSAALRVDSSDSTTIIRILNCTITQNVALPPPDGYPLRGVGIDCLKVTMDTTGTRVYDNKMGTISNAQTQISCEECPGCDGYTEPPAEPQLLWLLVLLIIPCGVCIYFCFIRKARRYTPLAR